jgi:hypothetical protein
MGEHWTFQKVWVLVHSRCLGCSNSCKPVLRACVEQQGRGRRCPFKKVQLVIHDVVSDAAQTLLKPVLGGNL